MYTQYSALYRKLKVVVLQVQYAVLNKHISVIFQVRYAAVNINVAVLDLLTQVRDVVFVKCIFSSGKPQGVGISE